ncbi:putative decaprenyl diphosphate synthase, di-trans-poly-cis-decaprenylcistransferase [Helianthus annuus]|nr:putative decaprenyl diphosphate synthase, di-trans-poly-cis-decaprenylcistransferase [Helianthus annuus]
MLSPSLFCSFNPRSLCVRPNNSRLHVLALNRELKPNHMAMNHELMPNHVAVIMDGNRRWARSRGLKPEAGYMAGARSLKLFADLCCNWGIRVATVFAFSSDNWLRPKAEVDFLMRLFESALKDEITYMLREDIKLSVIGDLSKLSKSLKEFIAYAETTTENNSRLNLVIAVNYSGKYDIVQACQSIGRKVKDGLIDPEEINEFIIENELGTHPHPHPDLLIRTSGEIRVSNFFLWQLAYTELHFTQSLWPDFGEDEFLHALQDFQQRVRRYGG